MTPEYISYNGHIWLRGYSNYFGNGYMKLTANMRRHPKKTFMTTMQVLQMLQSGKCSVAIDPKPTDQIIEDMPYAEWLKTQKNLSKMNNKQQPASSNNRDTAPVQIFETGATSAAVNELILYTDNTAKLAAMRDKIYEHIEMCELDKTLKTPSKIIFTNLMDAAEGQYFWEFGNGKESAHIKKISSHQRDEYCHIYANRFADWKRERELQAKQK